MAWIAPKLDWVKTDFVNAADFNRIENNTQEVVAYLNSIQYVMPALSTVTNRTVSSIDFLSSINRIESNIEQIRTSFLTPPGYLPGVVWDVDRKFGYADMNRLESNIKLLMDYGLIVYKSLRYCGATLCGGGGLY